MGRYATREVELDAAASRSRVRRSARRRQARADRERRALFDQGSRAVLRLRARPGPARGQSRAGASSRTRSPAATLGTPRWRRTGRSSRTTTVRIASPRCGYATGSSDCAPQCLPKGTRCRGRSLDSGEASEEISELDRELQRLRDGLLEGVPVEPGERSPEQQARFVLAHMMEFHRREDKAGWWEYFRLLDLDERELADERRARHRPRASGNPRQQGARRCSAMRLRSRISTRARMTRCTTRDGAQDRHGRRRQPCRAHDRHQEDEEDRERASARRCSFTTACRRTRCASRSCGWDEEVLGERFRGRRSVACGRSSCCCGAPPAPPDASGRLQRADETTVEAALPHRARTRRQRARDPGSARNRQDLYRRAHHLCARACGSQGRRHRGQSQGDRQRARSGREAGARARARRSHRAPRRRRVPRRMGHRRAPRTTRSFVRVSRTARIDVVGATAWCWARPDFEQSVDVLIVDEAGQMSLANVLATAPGRAQSGAARRSAAARAAAAEQSPRGQRGVGALSRARRRADDAGAQGPVPRRHVPPASGDREVHVRGLLRGQGRSRARGSSGRRSWRMACRLAPR